MLPSHISFLLIFFFFNDTATTEIYTLSLHDALPICPLPHRRHRGSAAGPGHPRLRDLDRKSTRLNSSHCWISYAVFCLKKKKKKRYKHKHGYNNVCTFKNNRVENST